LGNKPSPYVLRALCILGPEEILKLAHVLHREEVGFQRAAGDDIVSWKDQKPAPKKMEPKPQTEAKILHFTKPLPQVEEKPEAVESQTSDDGHILSSEVILMQREISRESSNETHKVSAKSGYQKATEMYVVKSQSLDGKEKIRFASTNGVLVNKKQA
jgi:hypothetical protein